MPIEVNVVAEPALLEQALGNLLDNAIDFTPEHGCITLSAGVDQEQVTLNVQDTGSGIPDYALSRIFERFYSLPRENGQKAVGWDWRLSAKLPVCLMVKSHCATCRKAACWPRSDFTCTSHNFKFFPHSLHTLQPLQRRRLC